MFVFSATTVKKKGLFLNIFDTWKSKTYYLKLCSCGNKIKIGKKISWLIFKHPDTAGKRQQIMNKQIITN